MSALVTVLDFTSLLLQLFGAILMYRNSPINRMPWGPTFEDAPIFQKRFKNKNNWLRYGFLILAIGIGLGLISLILKDFVTTCIN